MNAACDGADNIELNNIQRHSERKLQQTFNLALTLERQCSIKVESVAGINDSETPSTASTHESSDVKTSDSAVRFGSVNIREYDVCMGDISACDDGPELTIGWDYHVLKPVTVTEHEAERPTRRRNLDLYLSPTTRNKRLENYGFFRNEESTNPKDAKRRSFKSGKKRQTKCESNFGSTRKSVSLFLKIHKKNEKIVAITKSLHRRALAPPDRYTSPVA